MEAAVLGVLLFIAVPTFSEGLYTGAQAKQTSELVSGQRSPLVSHDQGTLTGPMPIGSA